MKKLSVVVNFLCIPKTRLIQVTKTCFSFSSPQLFPSFFFFFNSLPLNLLVILEQSPGGPRFVKPIPAAPLAHSLQTGSHQSPTSILGPVPRHRADRRCDIHVHIQTKVRYAVEREGRMMLFLVLQTSSRAFWTTLLSSFPTRPLVWTSPSQSPAPSCRRRWLDSEPSCGDWTRTSFLPTRGLGSEEAHICPSWNVSGKTKAYHHKQQEKDLEHVKKRNTHLFVHLLCYWYLHIRKL